MNCTCPGLGQKGEPARGCGWFLADCNFARLIRRHGFGGVRVWVADGAKPRLRWRLRGVGCCDWKCRVIKEAGLMLAPIPHDDRLAGGQAIPWRCTICTEACPLCTSIWGPGRPAPAHAMDDCVHAGDSAGRNRRWPLPALQSGACMRRRCSLSPVGSARWSARYSSWPAACAAFGRTVLSHLPGGVSILMILGFNALDIGRS